MASSFFSKFPNTLHHIGDESVFIKDILRNVISDEFHKKSFNSIKRYRIPEGLRPDQVSYRLYGDQRFHWILFVVSDISPNEWPMDNETLENFLDLKYGKNKDGVHHMEDEFGDIVQQNTTRRTTLSNGERLEFYEDGAGYGKENCGGIISFNGSTISNRDYEENINESRKNIDVLSVEFLTLFLTDFENRLNG